MYIQRPSSHPPPILLYPHRPVPHVPPRVWPRPRGQRALLWGRGAVSMRIPHDRVPADGGEGRGGGEHVLCILRSILCSFLRCLIFSPSAFLVAPIVTKLKFFQKRTNCMSISHPMNLSGIPPHARPGPRPRPRPRHRRRRRRPLCGGVSGGAVAGPGRGAGDYGGASAVATQASSIHRELS